MKQPLIEKINNKDFNNNNKNMKEEDPENGSRSVELLHFTDDVERANNLKQYPRNIIISSRYNILNFFPKSLLEQFRRLANVYFLVLGAIASIGAYTSYYETAVEPEGILAPVMIVVLISVIKDGVEDIKRHQADHAINTRLTRVLQQDGSIKSTMWKDLGVGDTLVLFADDEIPADCLVLTCGGIQGPICYVETAAIDGETNLKVKFPVHSKNSSKLELAKDRKSIDGALSSMRCNVIAEAPNSSIHRFNAFIQSKDSVNDSPSILGGQKQIALTEKNLLLRGSTLRATEWCLCSVVYTGSHTKLSLNSKRTPSKLSTVDRIVNRTLAIAITTMIIVCIISMIFEIFWQNFYGGSSYLCLHMDDLKSSYPNGGGCTSSSPNSVLTIFTFATLYNNFVCISMYVSLEMVYLCQGYFLAHDLQLYDSTTDTPAECHTSGMCADLGQIQYVLSDKTGTLTKNQMVVQQFSVGNKVYGKPLEGPGKTSGKAVISPESAYDIRPSRMTAQDIDLLGFGANASLLNTLFYPDLDLIKSVARLKSDNIGQDLQAKVSQTASSQSGSSIILDETERMHMLQFMRVLVYCNTAMIMPDDNGGLEIDDLAQLQDRLQAESPDEVALILSVAEDCGVLLTKRSSNEIEARGLSEFFSPFIHQKPDQERVQLLAVNEFDSDRKMMSVVVRLAREDPTGSDQLRSRILLLVKGADSSVLQRCDSSRSRFLPLTQAHIDYFANTGLRTLALAYRELLEDELELWMKDYNAATSAIIGRSEAMHACALRLEHSLTLVGAVGIEDELQDGVPEAISTMHMAGLNVWMITGDKAETALAIGKKCALVQSGRHEVERVVNLSGEVLRQRINDLYFYVMAHGSPGHGLTREQGGIVNPIAGSSLNPIANNISSPNKQQVHNTSLSRNTSKAIDPGIAGQDKEMALLIDGISLEGLWGMEDLLARFVDVIRLVPTVIACRVSPLQKAALVRMVKGAPGGPITLGIGDGANDVGMIHEARVGVGISGKEGRHAANAADFAIAQFRFIIPLLFEHGRFNYIRCSKLVLYSFFKNLLLVSVLFYFATYSGFSGTIPLDSLVFSGYNFYLGLPVLVIGATDFDISRKDALRFPREAYATGRLGEMLNMKNMAKWCLFAFVQGLLLFTIVSRILAGPTSLDPANGYWFFGIYGVGLNQSAGGSSVGLYPEGFLLYATVVFAMQVKVVSMAVTPNYIFWALWLLSFGGFFLFAYMYGLFASLGWYNVLPLSMGTSQFWLSVFLVPLLLALTDAVFENTWAYFDPSSRDILLQKLSAQPPLPDDRASTGNGTGGGGVALRTWSESPGASTS